MALIGWLLAVCWVFFFAFWLLMSFRVKANVRGSRQRIGLWVRLLSLLLVLAIFGRRPFHAVSPSIALSSSAPVVAVSGLVICVLGIAFACWARVHLGMNWGMPMTVKEAPELVTSGPYAFVRHPIYTGILAAMLGSALVMGSWYLFALVPVTAYCIYSAKVEERTMLERFPDRYRDYMARTKMLIPLLF